MAIEKDTVGIISTGYVCRGGPNTLEEWREVRRRAATYAVTMGRKPTAVERSVIEDVVDATEGLAGLPQETVTIYGVEISVEQTPAGIINEVFRGSPFAVTARVLYPRQENQAALALFAQECPRIQAALLFTSDL